MEKRDNQRGFTLVEAVVAGAILVIVSLLVIKGFGVSDNLFLRGAWLQEQGQAAEAAIEKGAEPLGTKPADIGFGMDGDPTLSAVINEYGEEGVEEGKTPDVLLKTYQDQEVSGEDTVSSEEEIARGMYNRAMKLIKDVNDSSDASLMQRIKTYQTTVDTTDFANPEEFMKVKGSSNDTFTSLLFYQYYDDPSVTNKTWPELNIIPSNYVTGDLYVRPYFYVHGNELNSVLIWAGVRPPIGNNITGNWNAVLIYDPAEYAWYRSPAYISYNSLKNCTQSVMGNGGKVMKYADFPNPPPEVIDKDGNVIYCKILDSQWQADGSITDASSILDYVTQENSGWTKVTNYVVKKN